MGKQKPHAFCQFRLLFEQALDQADECAGTAIGGENRLGVLASQGINRIVLKCLGKKPSVHVEQG
jgi:hypothetical protein